jgi:predicted nucleic-acid-binding protein
MVSSIQVSESLLEELKRRKLYDRESYEEVIMDLIDDTKELTDETRNDIKRARIEYKKGMVRPLRDVKKELGL